MTTEKLKEDDVELVEKLHVKYAALKRELSKVIVGQEDVIEQTLIAVFARGHALLVGVPGLAKTLLIKTLSDVLDLDFCRIQFTPDLMPADVTGTEVLDEDKLTGAHSFRFVRGPVFTNLLLADEINRTPPKTQAALLEAMQEHRVTVGGESRPLPEPFFVLATQNPIEQEGTYPLPEAQVDRFMFKCLVETPSKADERRIMQRFAENAAAPEAKSVCTTQDIETLRATLKEVYCDEKVGDYILDIVFKTREANEMIQNGASPRATLALNLAARGNALLHGRAYATPQDVKEVVHDVLRHRILLTYEAEAENVTSDKVIDQILAEVPVP